MSQYESSPTYFIKLTRMCSKDAFSITSTKQISLIIIFHLVLLTKTEIPGIPFHLQSPILVFVILSGLAIDLLYHQEMFIVIPRNSTTLKNTSINLIW